MATYRKRGASWRTEVCIKRQRDSATFATKAEAIRWAHEREAQLTGSRLPDKTLADAFTRYADTVSPTKRGARWERLRLRAFLRLMDGSQRLSDLTPTLMAQWRDERLKSRSNGTVYRELTLLRSVFEYCVKEWHWLRENPLVGVKWPKQPPSRKRRISDAEIERLMFAFGLDEGLCADTSLNRVGLAFLFALETAMRAGEITGLTWDRVRGKYVHLDITKNGEARDVPLSPRAREILTVLPDTDPVFGLSSKTRDTLFRRARERCQLEDLRFHDARAEAIWRLSKKLDVLELARVIGHRDVRSLMIYFNASADELADRL